MRTVGKGLGFGFSGWTIGGSLIDVVLHEQRFIGGEGGMRGAGGCPREEGHKWRG